MLPLLSGAKATISSRDLRYRAVWSLRLAVMYYILGASLVAQTIKNLPTM